MKIEYNGAAGSGFGAADGHGQRLYIMAVMMTMMMILVSNQPSGLCLHGG